MTDQRYRHRILLRYAGQVPTSGAPRRCGGESAGSPPINHTDKFNYPAVCDKTSRVEELLFFDIPHKEETVVTLYRPIEIKVQPRFSKPPSAVIHPLGRVCVHVRAFLSRKDVFSRRALPATARRFCLNVTARCSQFGGGYYLFVLPHCIAHSFNLLLHASPKANVK